MCVVTLELCNAVQHKNNDKEHGFIQQQDKKEENVVSSPNLLNPACRFFKNNLQYIVRDDTNFQTRAQDI